MCTMSLFYIWSFLSATIPMSKLFANISWTWNISSRCKVGQLSVIKVSNFYCWDCEIPNAIWLNAIAKRDTCQYFMFFYGLLVNFRPHVDLVQLPMSGSPQVSWAWVDVRMRSMSRRSWRWVKRSAGAPWGAGTPWPSLWHRWFGPLAGGALGCWAKEILQRLECREMSGWDEPRRLIGKGDVKDWDILRINWIKDETTWKWVLSCTTPLCCRKLFELH